MSRPVALLFATSGHSGVDRVIANLLPELGKVEHIFHLLVIRGHGPAIPERLPANIRVIRLPVGSKRTVFLPLLVYLLVYRPAVLLTANHVLNRTVLWARRTLRLDTRVVIRMGMSVTGMAADLTPRQGKALYASMRRWYPLADAAIVPSAGVGEDLVAIAGVERRRLHVIRNPIVNDLLEQKAREPLDHRWYGQPGCPLILGVGSLEPRKDFSTLIRAFARLREQRPARLIILGKGRERGALLDLAVQLGIREFVDLPGYDPNPYRHMRRADLFVLSSIREGASAVIVEALACGTPVVSTDCPSGPAETLKQGRLGRLVPVGDAEAMASAMAATLDDVVPKEALLDAVIEHRADLAANRYLRAMGLSHVS